MWQTNPAECFGGMHHIRRRCGRSALFFERPAHRLVRERVGVAQLDHAARQQAQRPAPASLRRRRAGQGDQVRLLLAVEPARVDPRAAAIRAERGGQALLHEAPPQALHGGHPDPDRSCDPLVGPARPTHRRVSLEQDLRVLEPAHVRLAARQQRRELIALRRRQRHSIPLHGAPPGPSPYRRQPERATPQISGGRALGLVEGATENAAVVQALLDDLVGRGLDPAVCRLFIVDGAKALTKAIRRTFGKDTPIQRCQGHKARNIADRLPKALRAAVRRALRQAWDLDDAAKAERLLRSLARTLEPRAPGAAAAILEGLDEILTVVRLGLPRQLRRSLACTNIVENIMGSVRRVCRNARRWRDASMALRWTAAAMLEAAKGFRRLKAKGQLPALRAALAADRAKTMTVSSVARETRAA